MIRQVSPRQKLLLRSFSRVTCTYSTSVFSLKWATCVNFVLENVKLFISIYFWLLSMLLSTAIYAFLLFISILVIIEAGRSLSLKFRELYWATLVHPNELFPFILSMFPFTAYCSWCSILQATNILMRHPSESESYNSMQSQKQNIIKKFKPIPVQSGVPTLFKIEGDGTLRAIILDYVIHHSSIKENQKKSTRKLNYEPVFGKILANGVPMEIQLNIYLILEAFMEFEFKSLSKHITVEPLVTEIIQFIQALTCKNLHLNLEGGSPLSSLAALQGLLGDWFKQRENLEEQRMLKALKLGKDQKAVKFTRMSISAPSELPINNINNSCRESAKRLTRKTIYEIDLETQRSNQRRLANQTKLHSLIDKYNIFDRPQKILALKKRKFLESYCDEALYEVLKQKCQEKNELKCCPKFNLECLQMLEDWVADLSLSQQLIELKYGEKPVETHGTERKQQLEHDE